jgi:hypothetical protein
MRVTLQRCCDGVPDGEFTVDVHLPYGLASPERASPAKSLRSTLRRAQARTVALRSPRKLMMRDEGTMRSYRRS